MIDHFPDPYPDELFYSLCARYSDRMQYRTGQTLARELFGRDKGTKASFPNGLGKLVARLPPHHHYTTASLIANHTLLPFYQPFLPETRASQMIGLMEADEGQSLSALVGMRVLPKGYIRFCSHCVQEDRRQFGECYWHRVHQLPGVEICPSHRIFLQNSSVSLSNQGHQYDYVSLEKVGERRLYLPTGETSICPNALLKIAQDALWLLQNPTLRASFSSVQSKYVFLLAEHGLATYSGTVYTSKLLDAFQQYYSKDLLEYLHCQINEHQHDNWVARFPHRSTKQVYQPVCHLLFIHFLEQTVETFLNLETSEQPFGTAPWPCLNPVCDHFHKNHIQNCEIVYSPYNAGRPRGTFSCECGFTYSRVGPDHKPEDSFRVGRVNIYGHLWETKLREFYEDPSITTSQAARLLGVDFKTAQKKAQRLGSSSLPTSNPLVSSEVAPFNDRIQPVLGTEEAERATHRRLWLSLREENPEDGITQLQQKSPRTYRWLYYHDREWLSLTPKKKKERKQSSVAVVNWEQRDVQVAQQIRHSALHLKKNSARPIRVTLHSLIRDNGQLRVISGHRDKLPLTAQVLAEVTETSEAFALRRVEWLAKRYALENVRPTRTEFMTRGNFYLPQARWRSVKEAVDYALRRLRADLA